MVSASSSKVGRDTLVSDCLVPALRRAETLHHLSSGTLPFVNYLGDALIESLYQRG